MGLYEGFRSEGFPTAYRAMKTAVTADVLEAGLLFAIAIIAFSLLLVIPGVRGKERLFFCIRMLVAVFVLGSVLLTNFGQEWEVAEIHDVHTQYRAGVRGEITADIAAKIGLRSINVTLKGKPVVQSFDHGRVNETIDYNERYHWNSLGWLQGRFGFGPFAGLFNREFRESQLKGTPYPILWIAEYFTIDGEGIRWGRYFRQAGFYTHIFIWTAFPLWIIALILSKTTLKYAAYFSLLTGGCLVVGNILFATIRNPNELIIPFNEDKKLIFHFAWCFWLNLATGLLCILIGLLVVILSIREPEALATFFDFDVAKDFEEFYADPEEIAVIAKKRRTLFGKSRKKPEPPRPDTNGAATRSTNHLNVNDAGQLENPHAAREQRQFRKRSAVTTMQKTKKRQQRPQPPPRKAPPTGGDEDGQDYENMAEFQRAGGSGGISFQKGSDNLGYQGAAENQL